MVLGFVIFMVISRCAWISDGACVDIVMACYCVNHPQSEAIIDMNFSGIILMDIIQIR
jgi:hypothetical protein